MMVADLLCIFFGELTIQLTFHPLVHLKVKVTEKAKDRNLGLKSEREGER